MTPEDERIAAEVVALGRRLGLPVVAVQPVYLPGAVRCAEAAAPGAESGRMRFWTNPIDLAVDESEREGAESEEASEESNETRRDPSLKSRRSTQDLDHTRSG